MKRILPLGVLLLALGAATAWGLAQLAPSGGTMTTAAEKYVQSLTPEQHKLAVLAYDAKERTEWHYIPKATRKGLPLKEMDDSQRAAAIALVRSALSAAGYGKAEQIMALESVLKELEAGRANSPIRDSLRYYLTLFGEPKADGRWGLSFEGHHLSLNFVVDRNQVVSSTPTFFGVNPGELKADYAPRFPKGLRVLKREEDLAFQLLAVLSPEQRKVAVVSDRAPNDVRGAMQASPPLSEAEGLAASEMTAEQRAILQSLIEEYARNVPEDIARQRLAAIEASGLESIKFCWRGGDQPGAGHDYRVQGATFLIEFNNTQPDSAGNRANHIHSVWHNLSGNFAIPLASP